MFDLIGDIVLSTFAVTQAAAILLAFSFEVAGGLLIGVVFVFLTAEALIDEVDEDTLAQVTELIHALPVVHYLGLSLIQS